MFRISAVSHPPVRDGQATYGSRAYGVLCCFGAAYGAILCSVRYSIMVRLEGELLIPVLVIDCRIQIGKRTQ